MEFEWNTRRSIFKRAEHTKNCNNIIKPESCRKKPIRLVKALQHTCAMLFNHNVKSTIGLTEKNYACTIMQHIIIHLGLLFKIGLMTSSEVPSKLSLELHH